MSVKLDERWHAATAPQGINPRLSVVLAMAGALLAAFVLAVPAWQSGQNSIIRLLHFWLVTVDGDDSWKPMRAAYDWYLHGNGETIYRHILFGQHVKFQYPPSSLLIFAIPHAFGMTVSDHTLNLIGWLSVPLAAGATGGLSWVATRDWPERHWRLAAAALAAILTLTFYPVQWAYHQGQIQLWFSGLFCTAAWCWFTGRKRAAGLLIGVICFAKPQFLLFLVWALLRREWRFAAAMAVVLAATFVASLTVFGWANHIDYLAAMSFMSHHGEAFVRNYSVNGVMHRLIANGYNLAFQPNDYAPYHPLVYWTTVVSSAGLIGMALFWRRARPANLFDFFIAALSLTMASPIAWEHHYGILPPLFAMLALTYARPGTKWPAAAALFLAFLGCDVILPPIAALSTGPESLLQATVFFGALTVLVLLFLGRDDEGRSQPDEDAPAVEQITEHPAHHRVRERAK